MAHSAWLQNNCRVCGGRLSKSRVSYATVQNQSKLQAIGISVEYDKKEVHPLRFCHSCYNVCTRTVNASKNGKDYTPKLTKFQWIEHTADDCTVCDHFGGDSRGRKAKKTSTGRPSDQLLDLIRTIKERSPPSLIPDFEVRERLSHHSSTDEDLKCPLCHLVLDRPLLLTTCNKLVCLTCCVGYMYQHADLSCPCCGTGHILDASRIIPAPPVILKLLRGMEITCERCKEPVPAGIPNQT